VAQTYDLVFVGNVAIGDIHPFEGPPHTFYGGPGLFCAMAAAWSDKRIALVTKLSEEDAHSLDAVRATGIAVYVSPSSDTTLNRIFHPTDNVDERQMVLIKTAGCFSILDLPKMDPTFVHLAGLNDQEFAVDFMRELKGLGFTLSVDMQTFVCQADPVSGQISLADVPQKREIARLSDKIKLDAVEAELLTGTSDPLHAAVQLEAWGCPEIMVTRADGILIRSRGKTYFESFSNTSAEGRTGRGDTAFGSYLARRLDHGVADSLKFAAALTSIKLETIGPFTGTLGQVLSRVETQYQRL
jgi:sugar/nucleoside kinase (ribokinase family)